MLLVGTLPKPVAIGIGILVIGHLVFLLNIPLGASLIAVVPNEAVDSAEPQPRDCVAVVVDDEAEDRATTTAAVQSALLSIGCTSAVVLTPIGTEAVIEAALHGQYGKPADIVVLDWDYVGLGIHNEPWSFTYEDEWSKYEAAVSGPILAELLQKAGYTGPILLITRGGTERLNEKVPAHVGKAFAKPEFWADPVQFLKPLLGQ